MKNWMRLGTMLPGFLAIALALPLVGADDRKDDKKEDKKEEPKEGIVILDAKGKENKIKSWEIVAGTRRLGWLAPPEPEKKPEDKPEDKDDPAAPPKGRQPRLAPAPRGPEALAFRDENSTVWANGVLTLIPLDRLRAIDFDNDEQTMTVKVAAGAKADDDVTLGGTTKFGGTNKLTIEAEIDKGELGVASVKYQGGVKNGIKGIRFPAPKAAPAPNGRAAEVTIQQDEKKKTTEKVADLQALYLTGTGERLSPILLFKKTIKLDVAKVTKLVAGDSKSKEWTVTLKDGNEETLTLLDDGEIDGKSAVLRGFVARVPAGWKLYPLATIAEISFEGAKTEPKP